MGSLQHFVSLFSAVHNLFVPDHTNLLPTKFAITDCKRHGPVERRQRPTPPKLSARALMSAHAQGFRRVRQKR
ncbi:hypothetical protein ACCT30_36585, partial [Rhizobium ruizarguesonis]